MLAMSSVSVARMTNVPSNLENKLLFSTAARNSHGIATTAASAGRITSQLSSMLRTTMAAAVQVSGENRPSFGVR